MTVKEYSVASAKLDVKKYESELREAKSNLDTETRKLKADMEKQIGMLREKVIRATADLERQIAYLQQAEDDLARGYEETR